MNTYKSDESPSNYPLLQPLKQCKTFWVTTFPRAATLISPAQFQSHGCHSKQQNNMQSVFCRKTINMNKLSRKEKHEMRIKLQRNTRLLVLS